jgi:hypothetical protein
MNLERRATAAPMGGVALLCAVMVLAPACHRRRATTPDWVDSAPSAAVMALSGKAGWLLEQAQFQTFLERFPLADQALDLFLKRAHINPHQETGRITLYVLGLPGATQAGSSASQAEFLVQVGGFRDQAALHVTLSDAFPVEGSLTVHRQELPLHVILDVSPYHFRAVTDSQGRVWLGDLKTLARLDAAPLPPRNPVVRASEWISAGAPLQGFLRPQAILQGLGGRVPPDLARNLPQGIEAIAWAVTPGGTVRAASHRFELAAVGSPQGVLQVAPWVQRFVAAAATTQGPSSPAPEVLQEKGRIGLRCQLGGEQVNGALSHLNLPGITFVVQP